MSSEFEIQSGNLEGGNAENESQNTCFICAQPAKTDITVPADWGKALPKAHLVGVPACAEHAPTPDLEARVIERILKIKPEPSTKMPLPEVLEIEFWLARLGYALFYNVFGKVWGNNLLVIIPQLPVAPQHRDLAYDIEGELRPLIKNLFPLPHNQKTFDYQFFEAESDKDEDQALWLRLPGGLEAFALLPLEPYN